MNSLTNPLLVLLRAPTTHFQFRIREVFTDLCCSVNSITEIRCRRGDEHAQWRTDREENTKEHVQQPRTESMKVQNINPRVTFILVVVAVLFAVVAYILYS